MKQVNNAFTMTALSNAAAWIATGVAVVYAIKKTGSAKSPEKKLKSMTL